MSGGGVAPTEVIPHLNSPDGPLRASARWLVGQHAEWGRELAQWFRTQLASPEDTRSSWQRADLIEKGGWAKIGGEKYAQAAELCADQLMKMEAPAAQEATATEAGAVAQ